MTPKHKWHIPFALSCVIWPNSNYALIGWIVQHTVGYDVIRHVLSVIVRYRVLNRNACVTLDLEDYMLRFVSFPQCFSFLYLFVPKLKNNPYCMLFSLQWKPRLKFVFVYVVSHEYPASHKQSIHGRLSTILPLGKNEICDHVIVFK